MKSFYLGGCREVEIVREDEGPASILACHVLQYANNLVRIWPFPRYMTLHDGYFKSSIGLYIF